MKYLEKVAGIDERVNDLIVFNPLLVDSFSAGSNVVVFFGGDIQDLTKHMLTDGKKRKYTQWSLEATGLGLQKAFPQCYIVVVRPSRMDREIYSCFDNFVFSGSLGVPQHLATNSSAWLHLQALCRNALNGVDELRLTLIGFSKGCVVLNQLLFEFHANGLPYMEQVLEMIWLDGGHPGRKHTWIDDPQVIQSFAALKCKVQIHVTPRQIENFRRPWIGKQEWGFYHLLHVNHIDVHRHFHIKHSTLLMHFRLLNVFYKHLKD